MVDHKLFAVFLMAVSIIFLISIILFKIQVNKQSLILMQQSGGTCLQNGKCIYETDETPFYLGILALVFTLSLGIYLLFFGGGVLKAKIPAELQSKHIRKESFNNILSTLDKDEKLVLEKLIGAHGALFQSDLVGKTELTKVKVTRILDKLEGKNIIERKRRGMTNIVILKI